MYTIAVINVSRRSRNRLSANATVESDEELLLRYRRTGQRGDFTALVHRYERELYGYLRRHLGDAESAEDAFQATFLQVHLKCEQFEEGRRFRPWLYTIATNQAIDSQRRGKRHRMVSLDRTTQGSNDGDSGKLADFLVCDTPSPVAMASEAERQEWLKGALDELPDSMRQAIHLVYFQGLKYREAAEIMDVPVGTVKSRLHAAVFKLNEMWKITHSDCT